MDIAPFFAAAVCCSLFPALASASCGAAFCSVNSNWTSSSAVTETGSVLDLRFEYINQKQPRHGSDRVAVGAVARHHDEVSTQNRNVLLSYTHLFSSGWGVSVLLPVLDRQHLHVHNHHGEQIVERWDYIELGDARLGGRYQWSGLGHTLRPASAGITFGLKLPTGSTTVANDEGKAAERTLQPGSGTTDALLGAYYHQKLPRRGAAWFAQLQYQHALNSHEDFRPGSQLGLDVGARYSLGRQFSLMLQLNAQHRSADSGLQAEAEDSGSRALFVSPGLSWAFGQRVQGWALYQKPLYQQVNGVQLTADEALVVGLSGRF